MTRLGFRKLAARVLKRTRKERGISQVHIAEIMETSQATISKIEAAQQDPALFEWLRFCRAFGVNPSLEGEK